MITTTVLITSDAECIASLTIAPEEARTPASSLNADSRTFPTMLTVETFIATFSNSFTDFIINPAFPKH